MAATLVQHAVVPQLEPTEHVVSEYANAELGALMTAGFVAWSLALAATSARVLRRGGVAGAGVRWVLAGCLAVAAVGAFVTAVSPTQAVGAVVPEGTPRTEAGRLHDLGSGVATVALLTAALASARLVDRLPGFRRAVISLLAVALVSDGALLAAGDPVPGVRQRVLLVAGCTWHAALLAALAGRTSRQRLVSSD